MNEFQFVNPAVTASRKKLRGKKRSARRIQNVQVVRAIAFFRLDDFFHAVVVEIHHVFGALHEVIPDETFSRIIGLRQFPRQNLTVVTLVLGENITTSEEKQAENQPIMRHEFIVT